MADTALNELLGETATDAIPTAMAMDIDSLDPADVDIALMALERLARLERSRSPRLRNDQGRAAAPPPLVENPARHEPRLVLCANFNCKYLASKTICTCCWTIFSWHWRRQDGRYGWLFREGCFGPDHAPDE